MEIIKVLHEKDIYPDITPTPESEYIASRYATRVVIFDEKGQVALGAVVSEDGTPRYSIIGGGIDEGESINDALVRESLEEAGCRIKNIKELGVIEERGIGNDVRGRFIQTNYCFMADVNGEKREPQFTEEDIAAGLTLVWLPLDVAIANLENQKRGFVPQKTLFLLEEAKRIRFA